MTLCFEIVLLSQLSSDVNFPKTCQLKYLDMSLCDYYLNEEVLEELLKSCHSLEKLSVRCELNHRTGQLFSDSVFLLLLFEY